MQARMTNPVFLVPEAMQALLAFAKAGHKGDLPGHGVEPVPHIDPGNGKDQRCQAGQWKPANVAASA